MVRIPLSVILRWWSVPFCSPKHLGLHSGIVIKTDNGFM